MSEDIEILVDPIDDVRFPPPRLTARAPGCADPRRALLRRRDLPRLAEPGDAVPGGRRRSGRVGMAGVHPATSHDPGIRYRRGELPAGWYRYVSDWRLRDDGTIGPRFGFAGTRNPRTCMRHQHHVYWRLDFDIDGAGRDVIEQRGLFFPGRPAWSPG